MRRLLSLLLLSLVLTALLVPAALAEGDEARAAAALPSPGRWVLPDNPTAERYMQRYVLSCEVAALKQALFYWELDPSEDMLMELLGYDEDPDVGFRGRLNASQSLYDYGAHAPALARVVGALELDGYRFVPHLLSTTDDIKAALAQNWPVLTWVPVGMGWSSRVAVTTSNGKPVNVVPAEHAILARGYDEAGFHFYDPGWRARVGYAPTAEVQRAMSYFDHPALAIQPIRFPAPPDVTEPTPTPDRTPVPTQPAPR